MIDKTSQFFAILTAVGEAKHANAIAMGLDWMFTEMGLGDANGTDPIPDRLQTQLINEWRRAPINQIRVDPANPNTVITEQIIPPEVGGEWIREIGLYDVDGDLVAVANCAPSYKPLLDQGSGKTQVVRMNFIVSSSANIVLKIDPAVVLATREYVDLKIQEELAKLDHKQSARVAATVAITLNNVQTIDDVAVVVGDRVLVTAQTEAQDNGLYVVSAEGWTRAADADNSLEVTPGLFIHVEQGTTNGDSLWQLVTDAPITLGTTGLQFEMIAGGNGGGVGTFRSVTVDALGRVIAGTNPTTLVGYGITDAMAVSENLGDVADVVEARNNLGLGTAATAAVQVHLHDETPDALMKVGAFGWGGAAYAVSDVDIGDLNAVTALYFVSNGAGGPGGAPFEGWVRVSAITPGQYAFQEIYGNADHTLNRRALTAGVWGEWESIWDSTNLVKQIYPQDDTPGRVLLTGAYGIGHGGIVLPDGTDLNTVTTVGIYRVNPGPNVPEGGQFSPMLVAVSQDTLWQQIIGYDTGTTLTRGGVQTPEGYVFSAWVTGWDTSNFDPAAYQPALGFTPVQQGGVAGQDANKIYIGYANASGKIKIQVDAQDFGGIWTESNFDPASIFSVPVGVPFPWPTATPPDKCVLMGGQAFNVEWYPALATVYPSGFLPDMRAESIRGLDGGRGIDPDSGRPVLSLQLDALQNMTGELRLQDDDSMLLVNTATGVFTATGYMTGDIPAAPRVSTTGNMSVTFNPSAVARVSTETRMRNVAYNYICRMY
ncbi:phage tail protein [Pseudomonas sp. A-B-19]|uniref:phage tail protein n=1 Tax=Pseudomonas sp. A-B-19 TaxID=2832405 RepID=UPI001CC0189F|nr:phage tail protein [Pseudomonas sp. A-B-19]